MSRNQGTIASAVLLLLAAAAAPAHAGLPSTLVATGCVEQEISLPYPAAAFQKLLPAGFKLVTADPAGLIAEVDTSFDQCAAVDGGSGGQDFTAFVAVTPPPQYQQSGIAAYGLMLSAWSNNPLTVTRFKSWGFGRQAAAGSFSYGSGLALDGARLSTVKARSGGIALNATALISNNQSIFPSGTTRAFAVDAGGNLHIIDATWSDQLTESGFATFIQNGAGPLPLPLPTQPLPAFAAHASNYSLSLHWVQ